MSDIKGKCAFFGRAADLSLSVCHRNTFFFFAFHRSCEAAGAGRDIIKNNVQLKCRFIRTESDPSKAAGAGTSV